MLGVRTGGVLLLTEEGHLKMDTQVKLFLLDKHCTVIYVEVNVVCNGIPYSTAVLLQHSLFGEISK